MQVENCTAKHIHVHVHIHVSEYHNIQTHTDSLQELFNCHTHTEPNEGLFTTWESSGAINKFPRNHAL